MSFNLLSPGDKAPEEVNVVIEISAQGLPVKYEVDTETGILHVDRFLNTAMSYPGNYGYVPKTLSLDGDPVDMLVLTPYPLLSGSVIKARPIGMLRLTDQSGEDNKLLAIPVSKASLFYEKIKSIEDIADQTLATIVHFFEHYKDLEPNKWVQVKNWEDITVAHQEILTAIERFNTHQAQTDH